MSGHTQARTIVILKLGGSLLDWPEIPGRLARYLSERADHRLVIVVGGGAFADAVRALDRIHNLGSVSSHAASLCGRST